MNYLGIAGLGLDLVGVLMLGIDLVRVQRKLRLDATERLTALSEVAESSGGIDTFLKSISGDWREHEYDEGRMVPRSHTFDYQSAERSINELKDGLRSISENLSAVAAMMVATVESDRRTASMSLWITYCGLCLIGAGFGLQILAYL